MLVYVLYPAVLRCHGNFLPICGEMEYIIRFLFILEGKHFCWGSMAFPARSKHCASSEDKKWGKKWFWKGVMLLVHTVLSWLRKQSKK